MRSFAGASGAPRTMSKVNFTSLDVNGWPSCHLTSWRRKKTRLRKLSCHDQRSASSPMTVSALSVFLRGSNRTRLLKHGIPGHTTEIVEVSWMAKPCERSSRSIMFSVPPAFGAWPRAGALRAAMRTATRANDTVVRIRGMSVLPMECCAKWLSLRLKRRGRQLRSCRGASSFPARPPSSPPARRASEEAQEQVDAVDGAARETADDGAVHADELQVVAGVLLDQAHRALRPQRADAVLDELRDAAVIALHELRD